ncbi:fumarylacetoacetate hydrolase family protein [uncultured Jatrophihabitans sp.]|uniref:fumarylacetoacetate hydrolase family protein n=1 Tax=uncultured Jatrophihabitans sp. TaxID=1610747 RepID=UPI0035CBFD59
MRWCTYSTPTSDPGVGLVEDSVVYGLRSPATLIEILGSPESLAAAAGSARTSPSEVLPLADVRLHAPVPVPPSVRDFMAFEEHVVTSTTALGLRVDPLWYEVPVFYFTNPAAIRGPHDDVPIAPGSAAWDFELEIAAVIGTPGSNIAADDADRHIAGYTVLCDWSARDLQEREMRLHLGPAKGKDTATSIGPVLVTLDELEPYRAGNAYDLTMTATVNGKPYSNGNFSTIHWSFGDLLAYASRGTELRTGDVIGSGTVGTGCILELSRTHGLDAYPWLAPGDAVTLSIEHLGEISASVTPSVPGPGA